MKLMRLLAASIIIYSAATLSNERPFPGDSNQKVKSICKAMAMNGLKSGVTKLVVSFEGLAAFRSKGAENLYAYYDGLKKGNAVNPKGVSMAFVADNILIKNLKSNYKGIDYINLPHTADEIGYSCIREWIGQYGSDLNLVLVGHSFGGNSIKRIMNKLNEELPNFDIQAMLSIDPRLKSKFITAPNVKKHYVYYQKGFLRGYPYKDPRGGDFTVNTRILGKDISGPEGNDHSNLTLHDKVQKTYLKLLR